MKQVLNAQSDINTLIGKLTRITFNGSMPVYQVEVKEYKATRSIAQNKLYWMWMGELSQKYEETYGKRNSPEAWSEYMKQQYLNSDIIQVHGEVIKMQKTTTKLNTKEFTDYLEKIDMFCSNDLNIILPHPEDMYYSALGIK